MALRPLPLAAGAHSSPSAFTTTLSGLLDSPRRALRPASSAVRSSTRTGDNLAIKIAIIAASLRKGPRASRAAALWRLWRHAVRLARCMCRFSECLGLQTPGRLAGDLLWVALVRFFQYETITCTRADETVRELTRGFCSCLHVHARRPMLVVCSSRIPWPCVRGPAVVWGSLNGSVRYV
jgi:hypothetical protein